MFAGISPVWGVFLCPGRRESASKPWVIGPCNTAGESDAYVRLDLTDGGTGA